MSNLIERYVHEVGRYVPKGERAEIQAELRSQIQDQLEDRFGGKATADETAEVLRELGDPRRIAASYGGEQYLVGPDLYPTMMQVLRYGWTLVPLIVVLVNVVIIFLGSEPITVGNAAARLVLNVLNALWIFSAVVVALFAVLQHSGENLDEITGKGRVFNPHDLPEVDDPAGIDRMEATFGVAFGLFGILVLLYFIRAGGLTVWFNLGDEATRTIIPAPLGWMIALLLAVVGMTVMNLLALRRNRWTVGAHLVEAGFEALGAFGMYYAVLRPLFSVLVETWPGVVDVPFLGRAPEIFLAVSLVMLVISTGRKVFRLWRYGRG